MALTRVKTRHQITLPHVFRKEFGIKEGDYLEFVKENDRLVIIPQSVIPKSQRYFWTKEWQKGEAEADKDIAEGRISKPFDNVADLKKHLDDLKKS